MPRIAWAKNIMNAYNAVKKGTWCMTQEEIC